MYGILLSIFYSVVKFAFKQAAAFISLKAFLTTLLLISLPIVLNNLMGKFLEKIMDRVSDSVTTNTGSIESIAYNFTGISAYFINHMRIDDALSVIFSAMAVRFTLSLIPFSRV